MQYVLYGRIMFNAIAFLLPLAKLFLVNKLTVLQVSTFVTHVFCKLIIVKDEKFSYTCITRVPAQNRFKRYYSAYVSILYDEHL